VADSEIKNKFTQLPKLEKLPASREWVYFVEGNFPQPLIKIGHSRKLKDRLIQVQGSVPVQLKLIGVINAPAGSEFVLHEIFKTDRFHCEWFRPSGDLTAAIQAFPKAGKIDGIDLLKLGEPFGIDERKLRVLLWNGTRRVERGMAIPGESQKKSPLERLVIDGFVY
jgi:hypothetical protein